MIKELAQVERQYFHWLHRGVQGGKPLGSKTKVEHKSTHENIIYENVYIYMKTYIRYTSDIVHHGFTAVWKYKVLLSTFDYFTSLVNGNPNVRNYTILEVW